MIPLQPAWLTFLVLGLAIVGGGDLTAASTPTVTACSPFSVLPESASEICTITGTGFFSDGSYPSGTVVEAGHGYLYLPQPRTWVDAQAACAALGGTLATVSSSVENIFIRDLAMASGNDSPVWIGFQDLVSAGSFEWVTGEPDTYTNWRSGEPNYIGDERYGAMYTSGYLSGEWNNERINIVYPSVCEYHGLGADGPLASLSGPMNLGPFPCAVVDAQHLTGRFDLRTAITGTYDLTITNPDGGTATLVNAITIQSIADPFAMADGQVRTLLHLGSTAADRITGYPTSGQSMLWDEILLAGWGPEYQLQPSLNVAIPLVVATTESPLVWSRLVGATPRPGDVPKYLDIDDDHSYFPPLASSDRYVSYYGLWIQAPSDRLVRMRYRYDDYVQVWLDGGVTPVIDANLADTGSVHGLTDDLLITTGWHYLVIKYYNHSGNDYFAISFEESEVGKTAAEQRLDPGPPITDLIGRLVDALPPTVVAVSPADSDGAVATGEPYLQVTFSEAMDTAIDANTVATLSPAVAGIWSWADRLHLCFTPSTAFAPTTAYTLTVLNGVATDAAGNVLTFATVTTFTTLAAPSGATVSAIAPALVLPGAYSFTVSGAAFALGPIGRLPGWSTRNGHYYHLESPGDDWDAAQALGIANGGHLATISDAGEDAFIWQQMGRANGWFGFIDENNDETFAWVDGSAVAYTNWAADEPNGFLGDREDRGIFWWGLQWNDVSTNASAVRPYVLEFDSPSPPVVKLRQGGHADKEVRATYLAANQLVIDMRLDGTDTGDWDVVVCNVGAVEGVLVAGLRVGIEPTVVITDPGDGVTATVPVGTISLVGTSADSDGPLPTLSWSSTGALIATGAIVAGTPWSADLVLPEGTTVITVLATDSDGFTSSDVITVVAEAPTPPVVDPGEVIDPTVTGAGSAPQCGNGSAASLGFLMGLLVLMGVGFQYGRQPRKPDEKQ